MAGTQAAARQETDFVASSDGAPSGAFEAHEDVNVEQQQQELESWPHSELWKPVSAAAAAAAATVMNNQSKTNQQQESRQQQQQMKTINKEAANSPSSSTSSSCQGRKTAGPGGSTKAVGKFKEKRPGPLNLTPSFNCSSSSTNNNNHLHQHHQHQDTPLDLSVKSAGNVPSGVGNVFNLQISANQTATTTATTTLETPRIAWHENEAQLLKQQHRLPLYSSTSTNAGQIARLSLAGDSPPITPNTPFVCDPVMSPLAHSAGLYDTTAGSFRNSTSSLQSLVSAQQFQYNKTQQQKLNDNLLSAMLVPSSKSIAHLSASNNNKSSSFHHQDLKLTTCNRDNDNNINTNASATRTPRRSCSTDNLSLLGSGSAHAAKSPLRHHHHRLSSNKNGTPQSERNDGLKKPPISPLVLNNLSSANRFSYSSQSISSNIGQCNGGQDEKMSPVTRTMAFSTAATSTSTNTLTTSTPTITTSTSAPSYGGDLDEAAVLVGAADGSNSSVANATRNLLNIHLNSPTATSSALTNSITTAASVGGITSNSQIFDGFSTPLTPFNDLLVASQQKSPLVWSRMVQSSDQNLDPLMSAVYSQQNQLMKSPSATSVSSSTSIINHHQIGALCEQSKSCSNQLHSFIHYQPQSLASTGSGSLLTNAIHSLGSTGTLNTPTIISPNQLKTYYLPSPILSPMSSSVFELPSPLVVFPRTPSSYISTPSSTNATTTVTYNEQKSKLNSPTKVTSSSQFSFTFNKQLIEQKVLSPAPTNTSTIKSSSSNAGLAATIEYASSNFYKDNCRLSESNLSQLVTSAKDKLGPDLLADEELELEVGMDIESLDSVPDGESRVRSATKTERQEQVKLSEPCLDKFSSNQSIPKILVSECQIQQQQQQQNLFNNPGDDIIFRENQNPQSISKTFAAPTTTASEDLQQQQHRVYRDVVRKRALSPQSFKTRIDRYYDERHESCSAPPGTYEERACSKIKNAANSSATIDQPTSTTMDTTRSCGSIQPQSHFFGPIHHQHYHKALVNAPYPAEVPVSGWRVGNSGNSNNNNGRHYLSRSYTATAASNGSTITVRSSSAEPPHQQPQQQQPHYGSTQHLAQNQFFEPTPGALSSPNHHQFGHNFSQSAQNLHPGALGNGQLLMVDLNAIKSGQVQSVSADELNSGCLPPFGGGSSFARVADINQQQMNQPLATLNNNLPQHQHHHQPTSQTAFHSGSDVDVLGQFQNNSSSSSLQLEEQINQLAAKSGPDFAALNQSAQGQVTQMVRFQADDERLHRHQQQQHQQQQQLQFQHQLLSQHPRALSADLRALSRSESSCSSADFCFRSSSSASGTPAKKYHCDQCSKAFTRSDMLTRHRRLHSGDRPFQCNECKQEFSRSDHLSTHMRTHTGEKPYKCKLCSYSACRKDMITRHMKVHNRSSPLPPALCAMEVADEQQ